MAIGPALITTTFPPHERGRALGVQATLTYLGLSTGPIVGGLLVAHFGWRAVFLVHLPIACLALVGVRRLPPSAVQRTGARVKMDAIAAVLWSAALSSALLWMSSGQQRSSLLSAP